MRSYLAERFPLVSQGATALSAYACCYILYGQAYGEQMFRWATVVGGATVVLLALVRRIVDDIEDLREDILTSRLSLVEGSRRYLRGLVLGAIAATALIGVLNGIYSLDLLAISVGAAAWFPVATMIKRMVRSRTLKFMITETCPAAILFYSYVVWHQVAGDSLPAITVGAIVGLFWTTYQFWSFTRKVGVEGWPPWEMSLRETRPTLMVLLALAAAFNFLVASYAHMHVGYLLYGLALSIAFAVIILRWWSRLPAGGSSRVRASWAGLPFAVGVEAGVLLGVLLSSL